MSREKPRQVDEGPDQRGVGAPPEPDEPPARASAYIPPMAAPKESRYHTIDMKAVRLSPDIDPQRMKTQLSLRAVRAVTEKPAPRVPAWVVLLLVGGALGTCVWWFARWRDVRRELGLAIGTPPAASAASGFVSPSFGGAQARAATPLASAGSLTAAVAPTAGEGAAASTSPEGAAAPERAVLPERAVSLPQTREHDVRSTESPAQPAMGAPATTRSQVKPVVAKATPAPRKPSVPFAAPASPSQQPASTQPKLWLE